jgi:hypothetical protein
LPLHSTMTKTETDYIFDSVKKYFKEIKWRKRYF